MPTSKIKIEAGEAEFILTIPHRDAMLLAGPRPFLPHADVFVKALGILDNFTVLRGVPKDSKAVRNRHHVLLAANSFLETIQRDLDLLEFDYSYSFSIDGKARSSAGESGFRLRGYFGHVDARPNGFCTMQLSEQAPNAFGETSNWLQSVHQNRTILPRISTRKSRLASRPFSKLQDLAILRTVLKT